MDGYNTPKDDKKINDHMNKVLDGYKDVGDNTKLEEIPNTAPPKNNPVGPMDGSIMTYGKLMSVLSNIKESMDEISVNSDTMSLTDNDVDEIDMNDKNTIGNDDLLDQLNQIFTPILIMQGLESDMSDQIMEACSQQKNGNVLIERNIIKFDDKSRLSQLLAVASKLIQRKKNTDMYNTYKNAISIANQTAIDMQREEEAASTELIRQYLTSISNTNDSSVARDVANGLLSELG